MNNDFILPFKEVVVSYIDLRVDQKRHLNISTHLDSVERLCSNTSFVLKTDLIFEALPLTHLAYVDIYKS
jgi:hypothetical protein